MISDLSKSYPFGFVYLIRFTVRFNLIQDRTPKMELVQSMSYAYSLSELAVQLSVYLPFVGVGIATFIWSIAYRR